ncbi:MAG: response regulator [candidate division Zixibacteria bacterium]|nr:response regulator [candidate division Zixibacteria bacterium]
MSLKVLIVDDESDVARYLAMIVQANGFIPKVANNVEDGLEIVNDFKPDLVCLDIMMPKESGVSMYQQLRENKATRHIPVIIISGAEQEEKFDFRNYLPDESVPEPECYMEKPVDVDKYIAMIKRLTTGDSIEGGGNDDEA